MSKMTDKDVIKALEIESTPMERNCVRATYKEDCLGFYCTKTGKLAENCMECKEHTMDWRGRHSKATLDLINRQQAEIKEKQKLIDNLHEVNEQLYEEMSERQKEEVSIAKRMARNKAIKEFAGKVDELLSRYSHLHKQADEVRQSTEEYADGTPMEMVSVWEVLSLKKWEMCDYETMNTLQDNIETIEKARLLSELEKDFMLLKKEMVGEGK